MLERITTTKKDEKKVYERYKEYTTSLQKYNSTRNNQGSERKRLQLSQLSKVCTSAGVSFSVSDKVYI